MNCTELLETRYLPTTLEVFGVIGLLGTILIVVSAISVAFIFALFIQESLVLSQRWPSRIYLLTWSCLSIFPIIALCLFLTILVPRSSTYTIAAITLFLPVPMVVFYHLVAEYAGGESVLKELITGDPMPLRGPPVCCVFWFLPSPTLTKIKFLIVKYSIYQLVICQFVLFIPKIITDFFGFYQIGDLNLRNSAPYLLFLNAMSFFAGVYGIVILTRMAAKHLEGFYLRSKFIILQVNFIIVRMQLFLFSFLGNMGVMPCEPPISSYTASLYVQSALLLSESFVLAVWARIFFVRSPPSRLNENLANDDMCSTE